MYTMFMFGVYMSIVIFLDLSDVIICLAVIDVAKAIHND